MWIVIFIFGLVFGLFAFSQIIYPIFSAWPRAKKLEKEGKLIKPIPAHTFIVTPVIWLVFMWLSYVLVVKFFSSYLTLYKLALGFILFVVVAQIPKQNKDLESDFRESWKKYIKE